MIEGTPNYLPVALPPTTPLVEKYEDGKKVASHFAWEKLPFDLFKLIIGRLDFRSIENLRSTCKTLCTRIDSGIFHIPTFQRLFRQAHTSVVPVGVATKKSEVVSSNGTAVLKVDEGFINLHSSLVMVKVPAEYVYVSSHSGNHFYCHDHQLLMVDARGQKSTFDLSDGASPYEYLVREHAVYKQFYVNCTKPQSVLVTKSNEVVCVTKGGTLLVFSPNNPKPKVITLIDFRKVVDTYPQRPLSLMDQDVITSYICSIKSTYNDKLLVVLDRFVIKIFDINTFTELKQCPLRNESYYTSEVKIFGEFIFVLKSSNEDEFLDFRKDKLIILEYSNAQLQKKTYNLKELCYLEEKNRIVGLIDNFLILKNLNGFSVIDISNGLINNNKFVDLIPASVGCPTYARRHYFVFDQVLIIIDTMNMEILVKSIPLLHDISTIKLHEIHKDFCHLTIGKADTPGYEEYYKFYPRNTLKFTGAVFQNEELLISYEFKDPGTNLTVGKILRIGQKDQNPPLQQSDRVDVVQEPSIAPPPQLPVAAIVQPQLVMRRTNFPKKQIALISSFAAALLASTIVFTGLTYIRNSTLFYKDMLGKALLITSAGSFGVITVVGAVYFYESRKRKQLEDLIADDQTRIVKRNKFSLQNSVVLEI